VLPAHNTNILPRRAHKISIALLAITLKSVSGIVSAVFNSVFQCGAGVGVAVVTSIQTSVQINHGGPNGFQGRAAGLWWIVAFVAVMMVLFLLFMKDTVGPVDPSGIPVHKESGKVLGKEETASAAGAESV
jgi:hypothetical protein